MTRAELTKQLQPVNNRASDNQKSAFPSVQLDEPVRNRNENESVDNKLGTSPRDNESQGANNLIRTVTCSEFKAVQAGVQRYMRHRQSTL